MHTTKHRLVAIFVALESASTMNLTDFQLDVVLNVVLNSLDNTPNSKGSPGRDGHDIQQSVDQLVWYSSPVRLWQRCNRFDRSDEFFSRPCGVVSSCKAYLGKNGHVFSAMKKIVIWRSVTLVRTCFKGMLNKSNATAMKNRKVSKNPKFKTSWFKLLPTVQKCTVH